MKLTCAVKFMMLYDAFSRMTGCGAFVSFIVWFIPPVICMLDDVVLIVRFVSIPPLLRFSSTAHEVALYIWRYLVIIPLVFMIEIPLRVPVIVVFIIVAFRLSINRMLVLPVALNALFSILAPLADRSFNAVLVDVTRLCRILIPPALAPVALASSSIAIPQEWNLLPYMLVPLSLSG